MMDTEQKVKRHEGIFTEPIHWAEESSMLQRDARRPKIMKSIQAIFIPTMAIAGLGFHIGVIYMLSCMHF